jgi:thiamine-phosphate pyrophosphorylase
MRLPAVHLITDGDSQVNVSEIARRALAGLPATTAAVHVRDKRLGGRDLLALARRLRAVTRDAGQLLLVNDRVDVALAAGADGVHLPSAGIPAREARRLLGPAALVGVSCHSADDVRRARDGGADYATFGPVFDTPSKRAYGAPVGLAALADAARLGLPLVALGGIDVRNAAAAREAGASAVAAIRAWVAAEDPAAAVRALAAPAVAGRHGHRHGHAHGHHDRRHGNPDDLDAYIARMLEPDRDTWQRPADVLRALRVRPGLRICEVGAGPGYFTLPLARAVAPGGRVVAVEVAPEILAILRERLAAAGAGDVAVVHGGDDDPRLPPGEAFDLVLLVNTFHHFRDGAAYLAKLREQLAPGGRLANVDFHPGELPVGPPPEHKVSKEEFLAEARAAGLELEREETFLPWQYFVVLAAR